MTLDISLCQHIHTIFITEVIEYGIIGIVRGTDGVDVQTFHAQYILFNFLRSNSASINRREVVTINTMEHHALTIDEQGAIVADTHLTETNLRTTTVDDAAVFVLQRQYEVIEVGSLSSPLVRSSNIHIQTQVTSNCCSGCCNG